MYFFPLFSVRKKCFITKVTFKNVKIMKIKWTKGNGCERGWTVRTLTPAAATTLAFDALNDCQWHQQGSDGHWWSRLQANAPNQGRRLLYSPMTRLEARSPPYSLLSSQVAGTVNDSPGTWKGEWITSRKAPSLLIKRIENGINITNERGSRPSSNIVSMLISFSILIFF